MTVLIYVNTSKQVGDAEHLKVFANADAAETGLEEMTPKACNSPYVSRIGRRTILAMLLIAVSAPIWNVLGR
jgi:hypothetical protein